MSKHEKSLHLSHFVLVLAILAIFSVMYFTDVDTITAAAVGAPIYGVASDVINPIITFLDPTPSSGTNEPEAQSIEINISIEEETLLQEFIYNWDGTNYSVYDESLLIMYNFDNIASLGDSSSTAADSSTYQSNGTLGRHAQMLSSGKYGSYIELDGNGDFVRTPSITIGGQFTLSVWVKSDLVTQQVYTRLIENDFATHSYLGLDSTGQSYQLIIDGPSAPYGDAKGGTVTQNTWQHIVGTFDGTTGTLYVDGEIVGSDTFTNPGKVTDFYMVGTHQSNTFNKEWNGGIDEVRIYNKSLTNEEVYILYASNFKRLNTTNWEFEINQSKNATDTLDIDTFTHQSIAIDQSGNSDFSAERIFSTVLADSENPSFSSIPDNLTLSYGQKFPELDFNATDDVAVTNFTVNDTTLFTMSELGILTNNSQLNIGTYVLEINVSDAENNMNSTLWQLNVVSDTFPPSFTDIPNNISILFQESLPEIDFNATDDVAVTNFTVNDTTNFEISETGILTNISSLDTGIHTLNITVLDEQNNANSTLWQFEVNKINPTLTLLADGSENNFSIGETAFFDINASVTQGDVNAITNLYQNGTVINSGTAALVLYNNTVFDEQGTFNITFEYFESENYTSKNTSIQATITYLDLLAPSIQFLDPTPVDADISLNDANTINISIEEETQLQEFIYNWNETNHSLYDESLLIMYNFDNIASLGDDSSTVVDNSMYQQNATMYGHAQILSDGKYDNYLELDGNSDYAVTPTITIGGQFSVSAWVRPDFASSSNYYRILENAFNTHFYLGTNPDNEYQLIVNTPSAPYGDAKGGTITQNAWQHIIGTFDGTTGTLYVDGEIVGSNTFTNPGKVTDEIYIGTHYDDQTIVEWNGGIDEVRIYNRSLNSEEVYTLYASNLKKLNQTNWEFEMNQSKNATDVLDLGVYTYQAFAQDEYGNENQTEQRTVTKGSVLSPVFTNPTNNSATADRTPTIMWNNSDGSDLNYTYDLQVASDDGFSTILQDISSIQTNNLTQSNVTLSQDLPIDTTVYFRIRAYAGSFSEWSEMIQIDTLSSNIISLPTNSISFGQIIPNEEKSTTTSDNLQPLLISNDGNMALDIYLNSTTFFSDSGSTWQFQIEENETSAYVSANETWIDMPVNVVDELSIKSLFHENNSNFANRANIHFKIQALITEPAVDLSSTIYIRSEASS